MPPKKGNKKQKIALSDFLGDSSLGSWADEMDSLPNAPAPKLDDDQGRPGDRYGRRDDFLSSRPDRADLPPRQDVPLPTQPPYTAFVGNLAFDLTESELEAFFAPAQTKSVKIIKDREDKPKGFGYVEFEELDGLKEAIAKSGQSFAGRMVRVSVAEPPKERGGFSGGGFEDDSKFDNPWRRDGPLPETRDSRPPRRFEGPPGERGERERVPSVAEGASDWRSGFTRPARPSTAEGDGIQRRRGSGFGSSEPREPSAADQADTWVRGSKFTPSASSGGEEREREKFGSLRGSRGDMGPPKEPTQGESDWRRPRTSSNISRKSSDLSLLKSITDFGPSVAGSSTPPTPQMGRRKLELMPRSGGASASPSPLSSPRMAPANAPTPKASPFGAARPVDVTGREKEVTERIEKDRESQAGKLSMSRTSSRTGGERSPLTRTPPTSASTNTTPANGGPKPNLAPSVRKNFSFASAAAGKDDKEGNDDVEKATEKVGELNL